MSQRLIRVGHTITGYVRHAETIQTLLKDGVITQGATSLEDLVAKWCIRQVQATFGAGQSRTSCEADVADLQYTSIPYLADAPLSTANHKFVPSVRKEILNLQRGADVFAVPLQNTSAFLILLWA